ncbi:MAG: hypothetical protein ABL973_20820 [Micropepsaceae bacterium]
MTEQHQNDPATAQDWTETLAPELKSLVTAKGYKSPADVVQAYAHAQRLIGADKIPLPKDGVWDDVTREKLGIPKSASEYQLTRPQLPQALPYDEAFEQAALPVAHKLGLTPQQVQGLVDFYAGHQAQGYDAATRSRLEEQGRATEALKAEWGAGYEPKLAQAARAARYFGGEALVGFLNESGLGDHPDLVRAFARAGALLSEDTLRGSTAIETSLPPDEALRKAQALMSKPAYTQKGHPDHASAVDQVRQLFEQAYASAGPAE